MPKLMQMTIQVVRLGMGPPAQNVLNHLLCIKVNVLELIITANNTSRMDIVSSATRVILSCMEIAI